MAPAPISCAPAEASSPHSASSLQALASRFGSANRAPNDGMATETKRTRLVNGRVHDLLLGRLERREFLDPLALPRGQAGVRRGHDPREVRRKDYNGLALRSEPVDHVVDFDDR